MLRIKPCCTSFLLVLLVMAFICNAYPQKLRDAALSVSPFDSTVFRNPAVVDSYIDETGRQVVEIKVPGVLPGKYKMPEAQPTDAAVMLSKVPAYDWSFGCSATAAAMMAGYYDNNGHPEIYTGPANGGVAPMNNSIWGQAIINGETRALCPLSATRQGLDGRVTKGHVDDYWINAGSNAPDPYIGNWPQHAYGDCTGDFMKTNQSEFGNSDGSTIYVFYVGGSPFTGTDGSDGNYGLRLFFESKGEQVFGYYNQYIYGHEGSTQGFTFDQYKQQIDAGRPVIIQLAGHSVLGLGYENTGQIAYVHNTWDYGLSELTWGGIYADMQHYGVSVMELVPLSSPIITIDPLIREVDWNAGSTDFSVISNKNWSISENSNWLTISTEQGTGNGIFWAIFDQNPLAQTRNAEIMVSITEADAGKPSGNPDFPESFESLLYEDFSENIIPVGWEVQGLGQANWFIENSASAGAPPPCLRFNWEPSLVGTSRMATSIINSNGISSMTLVFKHSVSVYSNSFVIGVSVSQDGGDTWQTIWSIPVNTGISPETVSVPINLDFTDAQQFRLGFFFVGNTWDLWDWNIDNIMLVENKTSETVTLVQQAHPAKTQSIAVNSGWSGVSSYLDPVSPEIQQIMLAIEDKLIILKDFEGNSYQPSAKGNIINWNCNQGYFIKMEASGDIGIVGLEPINGQTILQQGWNLIPVHAEEAVSIQDYFQENTEKIEIIKEVAGVKVFWPDHEITTLSQLTPGKAYLVKAREGFTFSRE